MVSTVIPPAIDTITTSAHNHSHGTSLISRYEKLVADYTAVMADTPIKNDALLALTTRLFDFAGELHQLHVSLPCESNGQVSRKPCGIITGKLSDVLKIPITNAASV